MGETEKLVKAPENGQHMSLLNSTRLFGQTNNHLQDRQEPLLRRLLF